MQDGFVEAVPFRDFRDGTGIFVVNLNHYRMPDARETEKSWTP
jgi:hypothetical protein